MAHEDPHFYGQFSTCVCECADCWRIADLVGRCICRACDDDEHDHMSREPEPIHLLDAYTWAGRRGACGATSERLNAARDRAQATCPTCLATTDPAPADQRPDQSAGAATTTYQENR